MEYCLKAILPHWVKRESLITTAITAGQDFHFLPADPWAFIKKTITGFDTGGFDPLLVLIGVPRLYAHKPLYCTPLYHELGHFVDMTLGVTRLSLLIDRPAHVALIAHRHEHFADLFAACYVGRASVAPLKTIAPNAPASPTHPSTNDRVAVVEDFLKGNPSQIFQLFQQCVSNLNAPALTVMHDAPDLRTPLDDIRPYVIQSERELHGIFESGWNYLADALDQHVPAWSTSLPDADIERIINDLIEKSIRNHSILERWSHGPAK